LQVYEQALPAPQAIVHCEFPLQVTMQPPFGH
jgi:hypothetical protein